MSFVDVSRLQVPCDGLGSVLNVGIVTVVTNVKRCLFVSVISLVHVFNVGHSKCVKNLIFCNYRFVGYTDVARLRWFWKCA